MAGIVTTPLSTDRLTPPVVPGATVPWWLRLSAPLGVLGLIAAAVGAFMDGAYTGMTADWTRQTFAQDLADLFVGFPLLLVFAFLAARGSVRALVAWLGVLIATLYTYVIYAFDVPFGHLYLANVALLGLSGWAFGGALTGMDRRAIKERFDDGARTLADFFAALDRRFGPEGGREWVGRMRASPTKMARIAVRPEWVGLIDFETRFPSALERDMEAGGG